MAAARARTVAWAGSSSVSAATASRGRHRIGLTLQRHEAFGDMHGDRCICHIESMSGDIGLQGLVVLLQHLLAGGTADVESAAPGGRERERKLNARRASVHLPWLYRL